MCCREVHSTVLSSRKFKEPPGNVSDVFVRNTGYFRPRSNIEGPSNVNSRNIIRIDIKPRVD